MNLGQLIHSDVAPECPVCSRPLSECSQIHGTPQPMIPEVPPPPHLPVPHAEVWVDRATGELLTEQQAHEPGRNAQLLYGAHDLISLADAEKYGLATPEPPVHGPSPVPGKRGPREDRAMHLREDR